MNESLRFRLPSWLVFVSVMVLTGIGCQDPTYPFDMVEPEDLTVDAGHDVASFDADTDAVQVNLSLTLLNPVPDELILISGPVDFAYRYEDSEGGPATVTLSGAAVDPVSMPVAGPGEYVITFVPAAGFQGSDTVRLAAVTGDGRTTGIDIKVFVDTIPPVISFEPPTPEPYQEVSDELVIRVKVTDSGTLVHKVRIAVMDFVWKWPSSEGDIAAEVDSSERRDVVIPLSGWASGLYTVEVTADDGVPGNTSTALLPFSVMRPIEFAADSAGIPKPSVDGIAGAGIRIGPSADKKWGIVTSRGVYQRSQDGIRQVSDGFQCDGVLWAVFDVNSDGFEDFVGYCSDVDNERIVYMLQGADGKFTEVPVSSGKLLIVDLAAGDLNGDGWADVAYLQTEYTPLSLIKVVMSRTDQAGALVGWNPVAEYIGASKPNNVEIGQFSDNGRNAVLVSSEDLGIFTVFPVDGNGSLMMGEDSFHSEDPFTVTMATNLCSSSASPDTVFAVVHSNKCTSVCAARMQQDGSARFSPYVSMFVPPESIDLEAGDVDADGNGDFLLLSRGSNSVLFFKGGPDCGTFRFVDERALVSGAATDIWLSDWDGDGYLDLCALTESGVSVVYYRMDAGGGHFDGSYQARLIAAEMNIKIDYLDVAVGHFVKPLEGGASRYLDAALQTEGRTFIFKADPIIAQPIDFAVMGNKALDRQVDGVGELTYFGGLQIVSGKFGSIIPQEGSGPFADLDGLVIATRTARTPSNIETSKVAIFEDFTPEDESDRRDGVYQINGFDAGNAPRLVAAGGFDLDGESGQADDVAFVWHRDKTPEIEPAYFLQSFLGQGDATFQKLTPDGTAIEPLIIQENRYPGVIISYPLRQTLKQFLSGEAVSPDLIVGNTGTSDFTVFLGLGDGRFLAKYDGSLDFAVGLPPIDVAAGYLKNPLDGSVNDSVAAGELPDVVTLTREGNTSVLTVSFAMTTQELQERGLDVGFDVPHAIIFYQPGSGIPLNPAPMPVALELADIDLDGLTDIVVLDQGRSSVSVLLNLGSRQFSKPYEFYTGTQPGRMVVADVNADGCPDILTADQKGYTMSVLRNRGCSSSQ